MAWKGFKAGLEEQMWGKEAEEGIYGTLLRDEMSWYVMYGALQENKITALILGVD